MTGDDLATIYQRPDELLRALLRFDTTESAGERGGVRQLPPRRAGGGGHPVHAAGARSGAAQPDRAAEGHGNAPPLLLQGHVDVVTTAHQDWTHPPFAADVADGYIWGRGALDMKGGVAMMVAAFLRAHAEGASLPGDVVLCIVSDEEAGGNNGARFLTEQHPEQFAGVRYALGELGGFTLNLGGRRFYPIMVAEKQACVVVATVRGPGGHASIPRRGGATAKLGRLLTTLDTRRLPVHITPTARLMIETLARACPRRSPTSCRNCSIPRRPTCCWTPSARRPPASIRCCTPPPCRPSCRAAKRTT